MKRLLVCTTALALIPSTAFAQASEEEGTRERENDRVILVTAERRAEDVQDVPISIVALSGDTLRERQVDTLADLTSEVPSLSFVDNGLTKFVNIRGVGVTESAPNQTVGVAIHQDGAYIARETTFGDAFFDVQSVQVLRGPQGTYSGQNASGGAIFIESARPVLGEVTGYAQVTLGEYSRRNFEGAVSVPVGENLAFRVAGKIESRDSYHTNFGPGGVGGMTAGAGNDPGDQSNYVGRAQLLWEPAPEFEFRLIHQFSHLENDGTPWTNNTAANIANPYDLYYDITPYGGNETEFHRTTGVFRWDPSEAFRVNLNIAYQETDHKIGGDQDYTTPSVEPNTPQQQGFTALSDNYWTGELNLLSMNDGPFEWTVGATFLDWRQLGDVYTERDSYDFPPAGVFGFDQIANQAGQNIFVDSLRQNQAVFAEVGYQFTDTLQVKVGGRYNHEKNGFPEVTIYPLGGLTNSGPSATLLTDALVTFNDFTGRVLVNWEPSPDHLIYATVSRGYKPGGITGRGQEYDSEIVTNWEAGWKGSLFEGVLDGSVSFFWMDYDGFQATIQPDPVDPTSRRTFNVDNTRIYGFEAQASVREGGFAADLAASYVHTEYGDQPATIPPGALNGNTTPIPFNLKGNQIAYAPQWSINGGVSYDVPVGNGYITPSVRFSHVTEQSVTFLPLPYHVIPERTIVDARLTYAPNDDWRITAYITNLFDELVIANQQQTTNGIGRYFLGAPQEIGVTLGFDF